MDSVSRGGDRGPLRSRVMGAGSGGDRGGVVGQSVAYSPGMSSPAARRKAGGRGGGRRRRRRRAGEETRAVLDSEVGVARVVMTVDRQENGRARRGERC